MIKGKLNATVLLSWRYKLKTKENRALKRVINCIKLIQKKKVKLWRKKEWHFRKRLISLPMIGNDRIIFRLDDVYSSQ